MRLERLTLLADLAGLGLSSPATPSADPAGELQGLIRARLDAYDRGGAAAWARFVTLEGGRLFAQTTGQEKLELLPENETTFFAPGEDWRVVFVRDDKGRVVSEVFRQNGQDLVARRLDPATP